MINSIKSIENTLSANLNLTIMFQLHHSINTLKIPCSCRNSIEVDLTKSRSINRNSARTLEKPKQNFNH